MTEQIVQHKKLLTLELKSGADDPEGSFRAVFSKFGVIDHDGDVTLPGAFQKGQKVPLAGVGHNWDTPVIGVGTINYDAEKAWIDGQFNLKMQNGREHYESVKFSHEHGVNQEYSYAYDVTKKAKLNDYPEYAGAKRILEKLDPKEVSQVLLGAGIGTGTLDVKSAVKIAKETRPERKLLWPSDVNGPCPICGAAVDSHTPAMLSIHRSLYASRQASTWDGRSGTPTNTGKSRSSSRKAAPLSDEEKRNAIQDAVTAQDKIEDIQAGEDPGWGGPWITATFSDYVIVRDDDSEGYLKIPYTMTDGAVTLGDPISVEQIWAEKSADYSQMKYADHAARVLAALTGYIDRSKELKALRAESGRKIGRQISDANRERIATVLEAARAATSELEALLSDTEDTGKARKIKLMKARAELGLLATRYATH